MTIKLLIGIQQRLLPFIFVLFISWGSSQAQSSPQEQKDDIDAERVGFITKELDLTPQEAQGFWPIYNKYRDDIELIRKKRATELMASKVNFNDYTDEEITNIIENEFRYRQKELDLGRSYNEEFKKILPVKKVAKLYRAEQLFKIYLLKDSKDKSAGQQTPSKSK